jgi:tetratricopeptide (TPR) repeat protein
LAARYFFKKRIKIYFISFIISNITIMKIKAIYLLPFFLIITTNCFSNDKTDSILLKKVSDFQAKIDTQNKIITELKLKEDNIAVNAGLAITSIGNYLTWTGVIFGIAALFVGGTSYFAYRSARDAKKDADETVAAMKFQVANEMAEIRKKKDEITDTKTEIDLVKIDLLSAQQAQIAAKNNFDSKAIELTEKITNIDNSLVVNEKKWRDEKINISEFTLACEKLEVGAITDAQTAFENILIRDENYFQASCKIAMCQSSIDENVIAAMTIAALIEKRPEDLHAHSTKGVILRRLGKYDEAINSFQQLITVRGQAKRSTYTHIGYCYMYKGEYDKSIENFEKGKVDRSSPAYYGLVKANLLKNGEVPKTLLNEAVSISRHDIMENPNYPYHNFGAAFLLLCEDSGDNKFDKHLKDALESCRNLGILNEQLFEYKLIEKKGIALKKLEYAINQFSDKIESIKGTIWEYNKIYGTVNV